jgi:PAS domain S-box-containing protein
VKWVQDSARYCQIDNGDVVVDGVTVDITERKRSETLLRESEQRLLTILDSSPTNVYLKDLQGKYLLFNQECERTLRLSREAVLGKTDHEFLPDAIANELVANDGEVLRTLTPLVREEKVPGKDGIYTYISTKFPLMNSAGVPYAICGMSTNISDRLKAEQALQQLNQQLEDRVRERTESLERRNQQLVHEIAEHQQTLAALQQSEQRFSQLAANVPGIIYQFLRRTDGSMSFPYISSGCREIFELEPELLQDNAMALITLIHPDDCVSFEESVAASIATLQPWRWEGRFITASGKLVWLSGASRPEQQANGDILWDGLLMDITERKQTQAALRESEERFRQITENINQVFWIATPDMSQTLYVSPAYEQIWRRSCASLYENSRVWVNSIHPEDLESLTASLERQLWEEYDIEYRIVLPDGAVRWIRDRGFPVRNETGQIHRLIGFAEDITERKQANDALRESEERFRQLAENINQVFWLRSIEPFGLIYISPAYEEVWGRTCESLYQEPSSWLDVVHPQDYARALSVTQRQMEENYDVEYRIVRSDGSIRWIRDRVFRISDEHGKVYRLAGIAEDITKQKHTAIEICNALEKERELGELKSSFVAMTSHEFRTPLSTIQSSAELLERYQQRLSPEKQLTHLQRIQIAVGRMTQMLNDILIISEVEAGKLEFNPEPMNLVQFCNDLVEDLQLCAKKSQAIVFTHQSDYREQDNALLNSRDLDDFQHQLDAKLLRQILSNLLSNALKYSPAGSTVQFNLSFLESKVVFRVQDQGIGIPPEDLSRLFESFHRATNVGTIQGTGLGLAIVKQFVDLHGGKITVESTVDQGSTFTVTLPLNS